MELIPCIQNMFTISHGNQYMAAGIIACAIFIVLIVVVLIVMHARGKSANIINGIAFILGSISAIIMIALMFQSSWISPAADVAWNDYTNAIITKNIDKIERSYGITDLEFNGGNSKDILLTSYNFDMNKLSDKDKEITKAYRDNERKAGVQMQTITFTQDGKSYSGTIKENLGTITIYRDGAMISPIRQ